MDNEYLAQLIADLTDRIGVLEEAKVNQDRKIKHLESKTEELESEIDSLKDSVSDLENP